MTNNFAGALGDGTATNAGTVGDWASVRIHAG